MLFRGWRLDTVQLWHKFELHIFGNKKQAFLVLWDLSIISIMRIAELIEIFFSES